MENFTNNCRFILICNYSNKLILLFSQDVRVSVQSLTDEEIRGRINHIVEIEKAKLTPEGLMYWYVCGGDLRRG